ncbi:hypothetical protein RB595_010169 [Gaeumannomyces hyphopodioides]
MEDGIAIPGETADHGASQVPYEVRQTAARGRGLFAREEIAEGARIIFEKPLLIVRSAQDQDMVEAAIASGVRSLPKEKQRQFLSLHNSHSRAKHPFTGIMRTNALPCGPGATTGGIYATISLINHSCMPNAHASWNPAKEHETIHAIRPIGAGDEITISYCEELPYAERQTHLRSSFGFTCACSLCSRPESARNESDQRRKLIAELDKSIGDPFRMMGEPQKSLADCALLEQVLREEFEGKPDTGTLARLYYDAFQIVIAHGDQARASVFASRGYKARVICEGKDSPATKQLEALAKNPNSHTTFKACSSKWNTRKTMAPKGLDEEGFNRWLFRQQ